MSADRRLLAFLIVVLVAAGCGDDGEGGDTTFLSEGTGEPNSEPLWTLQPGYAAFGGLLDRDLATVLLPPREIGGHTVHRLLSGLGGAQQYAGPAYAHTGLYDEHPNEPIPLWYLSEDADGIWFHGQLREGVLEDRVLIVPSTVRVGMEWQGRSGGELRFAFRVLSREVTSTPFGTRPVWTFEYYDPRIYETNQDNTGLVHGVYRTMSYVEGRGPMPSGEHGIAIVPLETQPVATLPKLSLTSLGSLPALEGTYPSFTSAIVDPSAGGTLDVHFYGRVPSFGVDPTGTVTVGDQGADGCVEYDPTTGQFGAYESPCAEGAGTSIGADGSVAQIRMQSAQLVEPFPDDNCNPFEECLVYPASAVFRDIDDVARVVTVDEFSDLAIGTHSGVLAFDNVTDVVGYGRVLGRIDGAGVTWVAADTDGTTLATPTTSGRLAVARLGTDGVVRGIHTATHLAGHVSVRSSREGFDRIRTTVDGTIERLQVGPDGITVEPLGTIDLPPGDFLFAAYEHPRGQLVLFTNHGYEGYDTQHSESGRNAQVGPWFGETLAWRATLPSSTTNVAPPVIETITADAVGADLRVCWRPGAGDPVLTGWTFGGAEPALVLPAGVEDNCVLLVRSWNTPVDLDALGAYAAEGPVPGAGRVAIGVIGPTTRAAELPQERVAPLAGGGGVGPHMHYGPAATPGVAHLGYGSFACGGGEVDLAGNGLWCPSAVDVALVDGTGIHSMSYLPGETASIVAGGGGLVMQSASGYAVLHPDGSRTSLGVAPGEPLAIVTSTGVGCSTDEYRTTIQCTDAAGVPRTAAVRDSRVLGSFTSVGDVIYAGLGYLDGRPGASDPPLVRFSASDPASIAELDFASLGIEVSPYQTPSIGAFLQAPDEVVYMIVTVADIGHVQSFLYRLDPDGPVALAAPELGLLGQATGISAYVDESTITLFASEGEEVVVVHVPR